MMVLLLLFLVVVVWVMVVVIVMMMSLENTPHPRLEKTNSSRWRVTKSSKSESENTK